LEIVERFLTIRVDAMFTTSLKPAVTNAFEACAQLWQQACLFRAHRRLTPEKL
jgi:hypothetical protein